MELHIYKTPDETIKGLADYFIQTVKIAIKEKNECAVVLSGGNSPKKLYELLASMDYGNQIDWDKVYFFFGDERYVPFNDPGNNGNMVKKALFEPLMMITVFVPWISLVMTTNLRSHLPRRYCFTISLPTS